MHPYLILSLVIAVIAILFALQNTEVVRVQFLFWGFEGSLALILLFTFLLGLLSGFLSVFSSAIRKVLGRKREEKSQEQKNQEEGTSQHD